MKRDYYEILGVGREASETEIKRAYRKMAMKYHPDKNPDNVAAEQKFKESAEAYSILIDPQKRAQYNQFGHAGLEGESGFGGGMSMDDIFSQFGDIFGGMHPFEDIFGFGRQRQSRQQRGSDLRVALRLTLEEIATGVEKNLKIKHLRNCDVCGGSGAEPGTNPSRCTTCDGAGQVRQISRSLFGQTIVARTCTQCDGSGEIISNPCLHCSGNGTVKKTSQVKVKVPLGVSDGNYMSLKGQGNAGPRSSSPGDLLVFFEETSHEYFVRDGIDVITELEISFAQAALGDTINIPTIGGKAKLTIPKGIQSGQILRMRGKGLPYLNDKNNRGDQLVKIQVATPTSLKTAQKRLFEELKVSNGENQKTRIRKIRT